MVRLVRRREFLAAAASPYRWVAPAFVLQAGPRPSAGDRNGDADGGAEIGLGFTASRRIGNAVARNRARRRLREAARQALPGAAEPGYDYVIIARPAVLTCPFDRLLGDLGTAFARVTRRRAGRRARREPRAGA